MTLANDLPRRASVTVRLIGLLARRWADKRNVALPPEALCLAKEALLLMDLHDHHQYDHEEDDVQCYRYIQL